MLHYVAKEMQIMKKVEKNSYFLHFWAIFTKVFSLTVCQTSIESLCYKFLSFAVVEKKKIMNNKANNAKNDQKRPQIVIFTVFWSIRGFFFGRLS